MTLLAAACAPEEETPPADGRRRVPPTTSRPPSAPSRTPSDFFEEGSLTVGTDQPVFQPWFGGKGTY